MILFLDSSAGVKYYVTEPGSTWVRRLVEQAELVCLAEITLVEVAAALGILERLRRLSARHRRQLWEQFDRDCTERFRLIPLVHDVLYRAALLCARHPLKAYDAVQLSAGLAVKRVLDPEHAVLTLVSSDRALLAAARAEGLPADDPLAHADVDP